VVKLTLVGSIAVVGWATQSVADGADPGYDSGYAGYPVDDQPDHVQRVLDQHDCSVTGFESAEPVSAIVRSATGHLRFVPFETGWRVFARHGPATLVAVCLDDAPVRVSPGTR
jgi:hypothetical protein